MTTYRAAARYSPSMIAAHWLVFILMVLCYGLIEFRVLQPKGSDLRELMKYWHFVVGLAILLVVLVRIPIRLNSKIPPITPPLSGWQRVASHSMHWILYLFMLVMPILGWLVVSAKGKDILMLGWQLPLLIEPNRDLANALQDIHALIGRIGYALIGLHVAAALFHHYLAHDDTLARILPFPRSGSEEGSGARGGGPGDHRQAR